MSEVKPPEGAQEPSSAQQQPAPAPEPRLVAIFKAFWTSIPGILTAVGGLIAALAAMVAALDKAALLRHPAPTATPPAVVSPSPAPSATALTLVVVTATPFPPTATAPALQASPSATEVTPLATPTHVRLAEGTILVDDFSDPGSGWTVSFDKDYDLSYKEGQYRAAITRGDTFVWGNPKRFYELGDFVYEADVRRVAGPANNEMALTVREQNPDNIYAFAISSDGTYGVDILQNGAWNHLMPWSPSKAIKGGEEWNHLKVECVGTHFKFYVNDELVAELDDATFRSGNIGLGAASPVDAGGVEVRFDNVRVQVLGKF